MTIHRFYIRECDLSSPDIQVDEKEILFQWKNVLRLKPMQRVEIFNGQGSAAYFDLVSLTAHGAHLARVSSSPVVLSCRPVTLHFALLKKDKTEWVIQKATEAGVSRLLPIITARTEKTGFDLSRAERIAREAAEQCGRGDIPIIGEPVPLIRAVSGDMKNSFLLDRGAEPLSLLLPQLPSAVTLFVGPEGGWTDEEKGEFCARGIQKAAVSDFTLRAETASLAALFAALPVTHPLE